MSKSGISRDFGSRLDVAPLFAQKFNLSWDRFERLSGNHKADIFRVHIMYEYGGAYSDVDTFPLDKLYSWYQQLNEYDFLWPGEITTMSSMGPVRAKSRIFEVWIQHHHKKILEKNCCFEWGAFGPTVHRKTWREFIKSGLIKYRGYTGANTVNQLLKAQVPNTPFIPFADLEPNHLPLNSTPYLFVHLDAMHGILGDRMKLDDFLPQKPTIFSALVGCALMDCWSKYEYAYENHLPDDGLLNAAEILKYLKRIDHGVCEKLKERKCVRK